MKALLGLLIMAALLAAEPLPSCAADETPNHPEQALKADFPQPYIVQPGDTLWDIAKRFFKDPFQWLRIWERNLYITNPDLIYPGNKIWFDPRYRDQGGLRVVRMAPSVKVKPVERLEPAVDPRRYMQQMKRYDYVAAGELRGVGYVLAANSGRLHFGANDAVYVRLSSQAAGASFDVFRATDPVIDPRTGKELGRLVVHLGRIRLQRGGGEDGIAPAVIERAYAEIEPGDRLKPAMDVDPHLVPLRPERDFPGVVLYIMNDAAEAGQNQVVVISPSVEDGVRPGMRMLVLRKGRQVQDPVSGKMVRLPDEPIGELLVLASRRNASMALVMRSTKAINIGDAIHSALR